MQENTTPTTPTWVTPYQAHQILNVILEEEGLSPIRPQMIYNYVKKGYITSQDGKINIQDTSEKGFTTWVKKYVEKKKNQDTKVSAQDLRNLMNI